MIKNQRPIFYIIKKQIINFIKFDKTSYIR